MPRSSLPTSPLANFLTQHRVWGMLTVAQRKTVQDQFQIESYDTDALLTAQGQLPARTGMIVSGDVYLMDPDLGLKVMLTTGDMFGFGATPRPQLTTWLARAKHPCEIAWLPTDALTRLCAKHRDLAYFFSSLDNQDHTQAVNTADEQTVNLLGTPIRTLIKCAPVTLSPDACIQTVAEVMRDRAVSSVLLMEGEVLYGLVTDRDLRNRVVAQGRSIHDPASAIATRELMTVNANSPAFEALLLMARHRFHHMPVVDGERVLGMITTTDLTEQHSSSAVYLASDIYKQTSLDGLKQLSSRVKQLQQHLAAADASAYSTGHIITAITDAITIRLIHLAEVQLGPPPIDYVWVAAGSQARHEQTAKSDQDNCLILDDAFDDAQHGAYFKDFSKIVCDGLADCGYIHCPGEMMAMTDMWRQPRLVWAEYFHKWVDQPKPKALMLTCVFFDLRAIHGKVDLLEGLRQQVVRRTQGNSLFLAHMVSNALKHRPPLGMFGQISLNKGGEHPNTIDLKHSGIVPIVDLARVYALAAGVTLANTHDRLEVSSQAGEVSEQSARDLRDALEFLGKLRIAHQARQTTQGNLPDNHLALEELSNFERSHLKDAFSVVQTLQGVLQQRYSGGRF